ncbi:DUF4280 domain-containing protein [Nocardioides hankookensis]|uniref:DUF4280 domain-containing protein n=1 Tax=Nocardioides hankookensis TaxID=443157 RepID=A0ABW1LHX9_9ACTN
MGQNAVMGAMLQCSFGLAPSTLVPKGVSKVMIEGRPAATTMDNIGGANIPPFGMCNSLANPTVAAATAAALGVLTPMPCVPLVPAPWVPGAIKTMLGNQPALVSGSTCQCAYGGVIQMTMPGAVRTQSN